MDALRKTLSRIARMDWDERMARLAQAIGKRVDLGFYYSGIVLNRNGFLESGRTGSFFFNPSEISERVSLLREKMGDVAESITQEADEIFQHRFRLLGYDQVDYGPEIDWHLDMVSGKRAPLKPWFKIDFLNWNEVGDHKVIWELNRHQHLVTLAKSWCLTADDRYVLELQRQWYSWQRANPYPMGINWASSLEVAFRSLSWLWALALVADSSAIERTFRADVIRVLALNGQHIQKYLSTYFSPNTHLLGEAAALFFIGTMCPQIAAADRWREYGWQMLRREAGRQVRPDGIYFEQSLYYHVYALDFLLHARVLADRNALTVPSDFDTILNKMLDVLAAVSQAGPAERFGDDDGGRVFDPHRNRNEHMRDPLAIGGILFQREDLRHSRLTEEAIWLFGNQAVQFLDGTGHSQEKIGDVAFTDGGIYVMASTGQQMVIDAGPQGTGRSGHGHADALSVSVAVDRRRFLVDSGTFCYMCDERDRFRGTAAHNTLRVDGLDQAISEGPFGWSSMPQVCCDEWISGRTFCLFGGSHTGYMRLREPVLHRREIFFLKGNFWLVRDILEGERAHQLELFWHFAPELSLEKTENAFLATGVNTGTNEVHSRFALIPVENSGWDHTIAENSVSPAYGRQSQSLMVHSSCHASLPTEHATLLLSLSGTDQTRKFARTESSATEAVSSFCYQELRKMHYMIFSMAGTRTWNWRGWTADARFLYFAVESGHITHFILCGGSFARFQARPVMAHHAGIERFEWHKGSIDSSDKGAKQSFFEDVLASVVPVS